jgi:hypothetical protein
MRQYTLIMETDRVLQTPAVFNHLILLIDRDVINFSRRECFRPYDSLNIYWSEEVSNEGCGET